MPWPGMLPLTLGSSPWSTLALQGFWPRDFGKFGHYLPLASLALDEVLTTFSLDFSASAGPCSFFFSKTARCIAFLVNLLCAFHSVHGMNPRAWHGSFAHYTYTLVALVLSLLLCSGYACLRTCTITCQAGLQFCRCPWVVFLRILQVFHFPEALPLPWAYAYFGPTGLTLLCAFMSALIAFRLRARRVIIMPCLGQRWLRCRGSAITQHVSLLHNALQLSLLSNILDHRELGCSIQALASQQPRQA